MFCPACGFNNIEGMDRCANCMEPLRNLDIPRADAATGIVRSVMEDELSDLSPRGAFIVAPSDAIADAVRGMKDAKMRCAIVLEGKHFAGIFTEHDAVRAIVKEGAARVEDVMTRDVLALGVTDSVAQALSQMTISNSRFIPIAHGDGRFSVISTADVLAYITDEEW